MLMSNIFNRIRKFAYLKSNLHTSASLYIKESMCNLYLVENIFYLTLIGCLVFSKFPL